MQLSGFVTPALRDRRSTGWPIGSAARAVSWLVIGAALSGRGLLRHLDVLAAGVYSGAARLSRPGTGTREAGSRAGNAARAVATGIAARADPTAFSVQHAQCSGGSGQD